MLTVPGPWRWTLRDCAIVALVPLPLAVLCLLWSVDQEQMLKAGVTPHLPRLLVGLYFTGGLLAAALVRKPGAALLGEILLGAWEVAAVKTFLAGHIPAGYCTATSCGDYVHFGLVQGLGLELGFLVGRYRRWGVPQFMLAGLLGMVAPMLEAVVKMGSYPEAPEVIAISLFSAAVLFGGLAGWLSRRLQRSGASDGAAGAEGI